MLEGLRARARELGWAVRSAGKRSPTLVRVYSKLLGQRERVYLALGRSKTGESIDPGKMVWIFGSGRSGSTWLRSMMGELESSGVWEEPMVGRLFGEFYARTPKDNLRSADFVMGDPIRRGWVRSIRNFVLDGARYSNPRLGPEDYLIIKEPNGSVGAPLLMEALPESRMILLLRPRRCHRRRLALREQRRKDRYEGHRQAAERFRQRAGERLPARRRERLAGLRRPQGSEGPRSLRRPQG
jgi:hypothetical protein